MRMFWRLLGFLAPYKRGVIGSFALASVAMGMTVLIPYLTGQAVETIKTGDRSALVPLVLAVIGAGLLRVAFSVARRLVAGRVSLGVEFDLRQRTYTHLQALELGFFDRQQTGQLMSRATVDLQSIRFFLGYGLIFIVQNLLTIVLAAVVMFVLDPTLAALAIAPVPLVVFIAARYGRQSRPAVQEVQQRIAELTADAEENVGGVRVIKAFAREQRQLQRFRHSVKRVFDQSMYATQLQARYNPLISFVPSIGLAAVLLVGGRQVIAGSLSLGHFVAVYTYVLMLISPMRVLGIALGMAQRAVASGNRVFQILDRTPEIMSKPGAPPLPDGDGHVEFHDVTFHYSGSEIPALEGISLDVPAGTTVALVGATGSGKTTLVGLVPRLYDVSSGAVLVDGADVREVDAESLRRQVALVADESFLFSGTIRENIAYARPDASDEAVEQAARRAHIHDFVADLPDGYEATVGERGLTLSGGQRQRVAIARALVADPRILILDDATASVDATTEAEIKEALREVMRGRTTFVIAHRFSTISLADEIVVLERGRVVARGTHDELVEQSDLYRLIAHKGLPDQVFLTEERQRELAGL